jgi:hypothetical protein
MGSRADADQAVATLGGMDAARDQVATLLEQGGVSEEIGQLLVFALEHLEQKPDEVSDAQKWLSKQQRRPAGRRGYDPYKRR